MAFTIIATVLIQIFLKSSDNLRYDLILSEKELLLDALVTTLWISLLTLVLSIITGFVFHLAIKSKNQFLSTLTNILKEIIMGTPLLVMIFLVVYVFGVKVGINQKLILGILALTLYITPYMGNAFESASSVISKEQFTIMELYHFTLCQRYAYVILPQMIKPLIPAVLNNLSSIIKGSALLKIVSVSEISYVITVISNKSYANIEGYLVMWVMYLLITIPLSLLASYIGKRCENAT